MQSISQIEHEIVEEFSLFDDMNERYEYLIDLGKKLPAYPEEYRTDDLLVKGCQSQVWLHASFHDGRMHFLADSNTAITKGIISLLVRVFHNQKPEDIIAADLSFIDKIQLRSMLTSQRTNGLASMIQKMKWYAEVYPTAL